MLGLRRIRGHLRGGRDPPRRPPARGGRRERVHPRRGRRREPRSRQSRPEGRRVRQRRGIRPRSRDGGVLQERPGGGLLQLHGDRDHPDAGLVGGHHPLEAQRRGLSGDLRDPGDHRQAVRASPGHAGEERDAGRRAPRRHRRKHRSPFDLAGGRRERDGRGGGPGAGVRVPPEQQPAVRSVQQARTAHHRPQGPHRERPVGMGPTGGSRVGSRAISERRRREARRGEADASDTVGAPNDFSVTSPHGAASQCFSSSSIRSIRLCRSTERIREHTVWQTQKSVRYAQSPMPRKTANTI
mmetsp:Transcript_24017/g.56691  ORF Transcript_24017/g.56691 Transcript_24017/m.56691 type:complete len:298 (-) Transcript_24017:52-945(-)